MVAIIVIIAIIAVVVLLFVFSYNGLVRLRNRVDNAWSQIDVQLKRRHDLIPNIVETVKGYAAHEKDTLEAVVNARNQAVAATGPAQQGQAEGMLTSALRGLFALSEAYPNLKANENFLQLQEELTSTEDRVAYARQFYNDSVMSFNTKIGSIPSNIIAGMFNFTKREFFEIAAPEDRDVPKVQF
jgi:LemA protein